MELIDPPPLDKNKLEALVGTKIKKIELYQRAFTHKSAMRKYNLLETFETLEFMGDSVLGFVVTKWLFDKFEERQEGFLTKARTKLVRSETLAQISSKLNLHEFVLMDDKAMKNGWNTNQNILEDVFEALIGAIYLDLGMIHAKHFILENFKDFDLDILMIDDNYKDQLMKYCQSHRIDLPTYSIIKHENGIFNMAAAVNDEVVGIGGNKVKKYAEQIAAQTALINLNVKQA